MVLVRSRTGQKPCSWRTARSCPKRQVANLISRCVLLPALSTSSSADCLQLALRVLRPYSAHSLAGVNLMLFFGSQAQGCERHQIRAARPSWTTKDIQRQAVAKASYIACCRAYSVRPMVYITQNERLAVLQDLLKAWPACMTRRKKQGKSKGNSQ
jgi:hypothetical protein